MFSDLMVSFFANFLPYAVFIWAIAFIYYPVRLSVTVEEWREEHKLELGRNELMIDENIQGMTGSAVALALLCIFMPIRSCINFIVGD